MNLNRSFMWMVPLLLALLVGACSRSGPVRRISEPAASIQQLTVGVDGSWSLELRVQNFSSIPMRFERIALMMTLADIEAGRLDAAPMLTIAPESADVVTLPLQPPSAARMAMADALASGRGIGYRIEGTLEAAAHDRDKTRSYDIQRSSTLNPMPGLPGVLR